ncbi:MAG: beta-phosphoglucomutase family hydrolase [Chthoniobacterales bacterium]
MTERATRVPFGAIFDWDGVIIDSAALHERSWHALADEIGKSITPGSFLRGFGRRNEQIIPEIHGWSQDISEIARLSERKEELYRSFLRSAGLAPLSGVREFLTALKAAAVPCAVASSTHRLNIDAILELLHLETAFEVIVTAEDVTRGKPDPEVFLAAASRLHLPPSSCVVFEDAHAGIAAARAAAMTVVAVTTTHPEGELAGADCVVDRLDRFTVNQIQELVRQKAAQGETSVSR